MAVSQEGACLGGYTPPCGQTDSSENITFPQLLLRTVTSSKMHLWFKVNLFCGYVKDIGHAEMWSIPFSKTLEVGSHHRQIHEKTRRITSGLYHCVVLKLAWGSSSHLLVGILPQHSTHISTGFFVQSTCLLEFYSRKSIICTQIILRIKEKNKKISFKLIGIDLS